MGMRDRIEQVPGIKPTTCTSGYVYWKTNSQQEKADERDLS